MGQATIVVVDDTDTVREVIKLMLGNKGYTVYSFADANDVVAVSENIQIDLFIIDMMMPKTSGIEALKRLNVKENAYEAIMITGKDDQEDTAEALKLGAYRILQKPFSYHELITSVEFALASGAAKKQGESDLPERLTLVEP
jgi:DNA-binding response OmpR family regulator